MKKKMIFAFVATMSFLAPNLADACSAGKQCPRSVQGVTEVSCSGTKSCRATPTGVTCTNWDGTSSVGTC